MTPDETCEWSRLDAALATLATTFSGMTAHPDESNCDCHWGSAEELALLKVPDVELDADLLGRTWQAPDWKDHPAVVRRILPQLAIALVNGNVETYFDPDDSGYAFARSHWQQWPAEQAAAMREFLEAWWVHALTDPDQMVPAYDVLALCAEASDALLPWLKTWESVARPVADRCLAEAVTHWADYLVEWDELPWNTYENEREKLADLTAWLVRHAPARLRARGDCDEALQQLRLLGKRDNV